MPQAATAKADATSASSAAAPGMTSEEAAEVLSALEEALAEGDEELAPPVTSLARDPTSPVTELATGLPPIALPIAEVAPSIPPPRTALRPLPLLLLVPAGESAEAEAVSVS